MGDANVSVDGKTPVIVHLNSPAVKYQQAVWNTGALTAGKHIVQIVRKGPAGTFINVDAFFAVGTVDSIPNWMAYQETTPGLLYAPVWSNAISGSASGGAYRYTNTPNAQVSFKFTGVRFSILARKAPNYGKLSVSIDGGTPVSVDLYAAAAGFAQVWQSQFLRPATHTVVIKRAGTKNVSSSGYTVSLDALTVRGTLP
jgi:hypothetical protein